MKLYVSGSWHEQQNARTLIEVMREAGHEIVLDWTSPEHQARSKAEQYRAIIDAVKRCDAVVVSLQDYEQRLASATYSIISGAMFLGKSLIVLDPAKLTRENRNREGHPVHPAFNHLFGIGFSEDPIVHWVTTLEDAMDLLQSVPDHT